MNFCCGVTLYFPNEKELLLIKEYRDIFEKVYIFDNTDSDNRKKNEMLFKDVDSIEYISNGNNQGLSYAFNQMCNYANEHSYDYICLLDQDSLFDSKNIEKMMNSIGNLKLFDVGIYFPEIRFEHKRYKVTKELSLINFTEVNWGITSGSFINLKIFKETKGFDINYFIDRLDYDYCLNILKLNYRLLVIKDVYLYQKLGQTKKFFLIKYHQHNPLRHYYIFRNRLYFYLKNNSLSLKIFLKVSILSFNQILRIILIENQKIEKIRMVKIAVKDYNSKKMGKIQNFC